MVNAVFAFLIRGIDWRAHVGGFVAGVVVGLAVDGFKNRERRRRRVLGACTVLLAVAAIVVIARTLRAAGLVRTRAVSRD